jgi:hypothetical protein
VATIPAPQRAVRDLDQVDAGISELEVRLRWSLRLRPGPPPCRHQLVVDPLRRSAGLAAPCPLPCRDQLDAGAMLAALAGGAASRWHAGNTTG